MRDKTTRRANQRQDSARPTRQEGRLAIVTNAQWNAVDAMATTEERGFSRKTESPAFADDDGRKSV